MKLALFVCLVLVFTTISAVRLPIMVSGNKNLIQDSQGKIESQEELVNSLSSSINKSENTKNVKVIKINTPFDVTSTIRQFRQFTFNMPQFMQLFGLDNSIQSMISEYQADELVENLTRQIKGQLVQNKRQENIEGNVLELITLELHEINKIEQLLKNEAQRVENGEQIVMVLFDEQGRNRVLTEEGEEEEQQQEGQEEEAIETQHLGATNTQGSSTHYLSAIKPSTLWGIIVSLFVIVMLHLVIGIVSDVKIPSTFKSMNYHVGKEQT